MRKQLQDSLFFKRLKDIEQKLGIGKKSPTVVIDYGKEDTKRKAKETGMTLDQYEKHLNTIGALRISIKYA